MQNNNPLTELFLGATAVILAVGAIILLYFGKIDGTFATVMFGSALALFGGNLALKVPSAAQQAQLGQLTSQVLSVVATHTHPVAPAPPVPTQPTPVPDTPMTTQFVQSPVSSLRAEPTPAPQFVPDPGVSMAALNTGMMQAVTPPVQP